MRDDPPGFLIWWKHWPSNTDDYARKYGRLECRAYWVRHGLEEIADQILAALECWKGSAKWAEDGGKWICAPIVWLRGQRWEEPPPPMRKVVGDVTDPAELTRLQCALDRLYPTTYAMERAYAKFVEKGLGDAALVRTARNQPAFLRWATQPKMSEERIA